MTDSALFALVCQGPHCRGAAQARLCDALKCAGVDVVGSGCLKVCKGPVAVLPIGDRWVVVSRVRSERARTKVVRALTRQRRDAVRKRTVRGGRRQRAIARGTLAIRRRRPALLRPR